MKSILFALATLSMIMQGFSLPFFGGKCTIISKYYDEFLYAADVENDGSRRRVFTWIPDKEVDLDGYFFIKPEYGDTFSIKNKKNDEYLYPFYVNLELNKRLVYTWIPLPREKFPETTWKIEPVDSKNTYTIKNVVFNEFLYPSHDKFDESRRLVYTSPITDSTSSWIITCDSSEEFVQFKLTFDKEYADETEGKYRQKIYLHNIQIVKAHNILYEKGVAVYSLALNADWTQEEFLSRRGHPQVPVAVQDADPYFASRATGDRLFAV